jgi:hypothetical protein
LDNSGQSRISARATIYNLEHGQEIIMPGSDNPFPLSEMMTQGFEQTRKAMESCFDCFQKNIKGAPWLDTDLTEKMKTFTEQNIAAASDFTQKASKAKDFQDFWRIQTEFLQAQWKAFAEQTKELSGAATKSATNVIEGSST